MELITFEKIPEVVTQLYNKLENIERLLIGKNNESQSEPDRWFDLPELCEYLPDNPARITVYGWVHSGLIPCHKGTKKLRFLKSEIDAWLIQGKKKTYAEIKTEAEAYVKQRG